MLTNSLILILVLLTRGRLKSFETILWFLQCSFRVHMRTFVGESSHVITCLEDIYVKIQIMISKMSLSYGNNLQNLKVILN